MKTPPAPRGRARRPAFGLALACFVLALAAPPRAAAQGTPSPPERLTYQGFLTDGNGVALGNTAPKNYDVVFRIWNSENQSAGPNLLWAEQQTVTVDKGYFSVLLGEGAPVGQPRPPLSTLFNGPTASDRWVGITVNGIGAGGGNVDILPRLRLISSPYAFLAQQANKLVQSTGADLITANNNQVTVAGPVTATSFSGSGTDLTGVAKLNGGNTFNGNQVLNDRLGLGGNPSFRLHVQDASWPTAVITSSSVIGTWLALANSSSGGQHWQFISSGSGNGEGAGKLLIGSGPAAGTTGIRMTLDGAGNVGIGTPSPGRRLHVAGSVAIDGLNPIEFGRGFTKEISAGQIGYGTHSGGASGSLDIVGAGTTGNNRRVTIWSEGRMQVYGGVDVQGGLRARGGAPGGNGVNNNGYAFTGNGGDNDSGMFSEADGVLQFFSNSGERMRINSNGRVGIGTSDPVTRLHVTSWVNRFINTRYFNRNGGLNASDNIEISIGIKAEGGVEALGFYAVSDERIKEVVGRSDTARDLEVVRRLSVKDYRMKDTAEHGETLHKGVIAQEVRIVMPEAVNQGRGFIPSIYAVADTKAFDSTAKTLRVGLSGAHQLKAGDRVRLISDDSIEAYTVAAVPDERTFVVSDVFKAPERLFVYGVEVADFLSVDYDRLFTAGIGAIQELAKQVEALRRSEARVAELEQKVARMETLQTEVAELKQRMNQFAALEQMLREVMDARNAEGAARLRPVSGQPPVARR